MCKKNNLHLFLLLTTVIMMGANVYDKDLKVIEALKDNGSDTTKPHNIDFFLDFKKMESASSVAQSMDKDGYKIKMYKNDDGTISIEAKKIVIPSPDNMTEITKQLEGLTEKFGGKYDGWGTEIVE